GAEEFSQAAAESAILNAADVRGDTFDAIIIDGAYQAMLGGIVGGGMGSISRTGLLIAANLEKAGMPSDTAKEVAKQTIKAGLSEEAQAEAIKVLEGETSPLTYKDANPKAAAKEFARIYQEETDPARRAQLANEAFNIGEQTQAHAKENGLSDEEAELIGRVQQSRAIRAYENTGVLPSEWIKTHAINIRRENGQLGVEGEGFNQLIYKGYGAGNNMSHNAAEAYERGLVDDNNIITALEEKFPEASKDEIRVLKLFSYSEWHHVGSDFAEMSFYDLSLLDKPEELYSRRFHLDNEEEKLSTLEFARLYLKKEQEEERRNKEWKQKDRIRAEEAEQDVRALEIALGKTDLGMDRFQFVVFSRLTPQMQKIVLESNPHYDVSLSGNIYERDTKPDSEEVKEGTRRLVFRPEYNNRLKEVALEIYKDGKWETQETAEVNMGYSDGKYFSRVIAEDKATAQRIAKGDYMQTQTFFQAAAMYRNPRKDIAEFIEFAKSKTEKKQSYFEHKTVSGVNVIIPTDSVKHSFKKHPDLTNADFQILLDNIDNAPVFKAAEQKPRYNGEVYLGEFKTGTTSYGFAFEAFKNGQRIITTLFKDNPKSIDRWIKKETVNAPQSFVFNSRLTTSEKVADAFVEQSNNSIAQEGQNVNRDITRTARDLRESSAR
ncbi:MAG: hypothetical protein LBG46_05930, partial [Elusimicrobiota bacterium]|nr:hypothetical protein [Elusimicrobiota bacterium]